MGQRYQIEPDKLLEVLKSTVIKSTDKHAVTNEEVAAFVIVANQYGLNPFTREIHAFASQSGGIVPIVGVDGWSHIVNSRDDFDGCEFEDILVDKLGAGIKCTIFVKGRSHPVSVTEWLSECQRKTIPWTTMPRRMLRHKAFMQCGRICFGLSGIYDEDEARDIVKVQVSESGGDKNGQSRTDALLDKLGGPSEPPTFKDTLQAAVDNVSGDQQPDNGAIDEMGDVSKSTVDTGPEPMDGPAPRKQVNRK